MIQSRSEEHTSELQSLTNLVCRLLLEKKKKTDELGWHWLGVCKRVPHRQSVQVVWSWFISHSKLRGRATRSASAFCSLFFFFNDTATTEIYTLSLHDALPISSPQRGRSARGAGGSRRPREF